MNEITEVEEAPRSVVLVGAEAVDEDTGEVLEWPADCTTGPERMAYLTHLHREADREVKAWEIEKGKWARLLNRAASEAGVKSFKSDYGSVVNVAPGKQRQAHALSVANAAALELITATEATTVLLAAAKELDAKAIEAWIDALEGDDAEALAERKKWLRLALITESPRSGYTYTREPAKPSPRRDGETK